MKCEHCGCKLIVVDSRRVIKDTKFKRLVRGIRRRRECISCKQRITTYEFSRGDLRKKNTNLDKLRKRFLILLTMMIHCQ